MIEVRESKIKRKPGERRRSVLHPYTVLCGHCGSLYSQRGGGLIGCSGRDRKITECNNRGMKEDILFNFIVTSLVKEFNLFGGLEKVLSQVDEMKGKKKKIIHSEDRFKEAELKQKKAAIRKYQHLFETTNDNDEVLVKHMKKIGKEIGAIEEMLVQLKTTPYGHKPC